MGHWVGEDTSPKVEVFKDFGSADLGDKGGDLLLRAGADGHFSSETIFEALRRADVIPQDKSWENEKTRLAQQPQSTGVTNNVNWLIGPHRRRKSTHGGAKDARERG